MSTYANPLTEYSPQLEMPGFPRGFADESREGVFDELEEMDLAAGLLEVSNERELDLFLGDLIRAAGKALGGVARSPVGKAIGGALKSLVGKALPLAGTVVGGMVGGPLGARVGSMLASAAGPALGLELEGLSPEDQEFEASKRFMRFAAEAVRIALLAPPGSDPAAVAQEAITQAARLYAPGLVNRAAEMRSGENAMHDIDRTQVAPGYEFENDPYSSGEFESAGNDEMELAAQLMELTSEAEFEYFLGDLISRAAKAVGGYISSKTGQSLGGLLKGAARQVLPILDQALGGAATGETGGEYEQVEELELEAATTFVRLAQEAAVNAAQAPPGADPGAVANKAVADAAQKHAPDLLSPAARPASTPMGAGFHPAGRPHGRRGRWVRHGHRIILYGV